MCAATPNMPDRPPISVLGEHKDLAVAPSNPLTFGPAAYFAAHPTHVLVVDDDARIRSLLSDYLRRHHMDVSEASNGEEASQQLRYFHVDLCIMDVMMPGPSGLTMTRTLRQAPEPLASTPIMILTAKGEPAHRIEGLAVGADDYLGKPFYPEELLWRMQRLLERHRDRTHMAATNLAPMEDGVVLGHQMLFLSKAYLQDLITHHITPLTDTEVRLLRCLLQHRHQHVAREALAALCGDVNPRSVDVQMIRLRQKIEKHPKHPMHLRSVRGVGYLLQL